MYEMINSPFQLGPLLLKNRIIFAPTSFGLPKEDFFQTIEKIAAGGCAMIIAGDVPVGNSWSAPSLFDRKGRQYYQRLTAIAHKYNCLICAQLHQSDSDLFYLLRQIPQVLPKRISPDQLRARLNARTGPYISSLPVKKIQKITASFGASAKAAVDLGFDLVQVHGDRMCGSFSSSIFNRRTDQYGMTAENRARFAVECVAAIHEAIPQLPIDFKLAVRQENPHYGNAGILLEELGVFLSALEEAGAGSFHVALANHSALSDIIPPDGHPYFSGEGCFLRFCDEVRKFTTLPLCGVGGLSTPGFIEQQLESGRIQLAAMSRQLIADPEWVVKAANGKENQIHYCIRCNKKCLGGMQSHKGVHCIYDKKKEVIT